MPIRFKKGSPRRRHFIAEWRRHRQLSQAALGAELDEHVRAMNAVYQRRRDLVVSMLNQATGINCAKPEGAFYLFPKAPHGTATEFVAEAIRNQLLCIPGSVFSRHDTHFRLSYAADERTLDRGVEILNRLAKK